MEKKEARIKCNGCGTSYKIKVPVTEKPVSFKCKKCGKVLKLRIQSVSRSSSPATPPPGSISAPPPNFETTQLPESNSYHDQPSPRQAGLSTPSFAESHFFPQSSDQPPASEDKTRRWIVLSGDLIKGPFTDHEIMAMIDQGEITAETSLRMGERPWIKAVEITNFRDLFPSGQRALRNGPLASITLLDAPVEQGKGEQEMSGPRFYEQLPALLPYPLSGGNWQPFAIFVGIAIVLCTLLTFEFLVGLPVSLLGSTILYGYLGVLMQNSRQFPDQSPPAWDFSKAKDTVAAGFKILLLVLTYSLVPVGIMLLCMIAFFLNSMGALGYAFMALTIVVYLASLFVVPAGLVILDRSKTVGVALSPGKIQGIIRKGGKPYLMLSVVSIATGVACMVVAIGAVFVVDIPDIGFLLAGLLMALVLSYGHFVWFHVLGRFSRENERLTSQVVAPVST